MTKKTKHKNPTTVAIIGGGVAGSTIAIRLAMAGVNVHLFEKNASLINSPPMCHLHAGGNLYREINTDDCKTLMRQCIDIAKLYPDSIDVRPTVFAVPKRDKGSAQDLLSRLKVLTEYYRELIKADKTNEVLGQADHYYQVFDKADLEQLSGCEPKAMPSDTEEWLIPVTQLVDLDKLQMPIYAVQEYGWNIFRLSASAFLQLDRLPNAHIHLNTAINELAQNNKTHDWQLTFCNDQGQTQHLTADFVVNACGFRTGIIDDQVGVKVERMVEFKASYLSQWTSKTAYKGQLPEIIFHGERGTPQGMAQFTPYPDGIFQLHGMTEAITLFKDGLTHSSDNSSQPPMNPQYISYIENGWDTPTLVKRTQNAIDYVAEFIPNFGNATPIDKALFGGQQVPSADISTRVADLQVFEHQRYAIAENVKANSALDVADGVITALIQAKFLDPSAKKRPIWHTLDVKDINKLAKKLAKQRRFPVGMAKVNHALILPR